MTRRIADETFTHLTVMRLQSVAENLRVQQSTAGTRAQVRSAFNV
jgi:hypothetical protein